MIRGSGCSKSRCGGGRSAEKWKMASRCGEKCIFKSKWPLFEVQIPKNGTPLWREARFQVKMYKNTAFLDQFLEEIRGLCLVIWVSRKQMVPDGSVDDWGAWTNEAVKAAKGCFYLKNTSGMIYTVLYCDVSVLKSLQWFTCVFPCLKLIKSP